MELYNEENPKGTKFSELLMDGCVIPFFTAREALRSALTQPESWNPQRYAAAQDTLISYLDTIEFDEKTFCFSRKMKIPGTISFPIPIDVTAIGQDIETINRQLAEKEWPLSPGEK